MTSSLFSPDTHWKAEKDGLNLKLSTGPAHRKQHRVLIAAGIFSKVLLAIPATHARRCTGSHGPDQRHLMSRKLELTFACGDYEIMRALKEGIVRRKGSSSRY
jgi:hypothetical protein